jgi:copper chaperone CopZ
MKSLFLSLVAVLALTQASRAADVTATINNVHLCCNSCVKGAQKAVATVDGATVVCDKDARTVAITAPDTATAQKAADALVQAGFFGDSTDVKINADTGAKGVKVQSLTVENVHLCCPKCVKAVNAALTSVPGVTGNTAQKGATSFVVTGDFTDTDVFTALQKAGLTGTEAK